MKILISLILIMISGIIISLSVVTFVVDENSNFNITYPNGQGFGGYEYTTDYYLDSSKFNYYLDTSSAEGNTLVLNRKDTNQEVNILLNNPAYSSSEFLVGNGFIEVGKIGSRTEFVPKSDCKTIVIPIKLFYYYNFDTINTAIQIPNGAALVDEHGIDSSRDFKAVSAFDIFYCKYS